MRSATAARPHWARWLDAAGLTDGRITQYAVAFTWWELDRLGRPSRDTELVPCVSAESADPGEARKQARRIGREQRREGLPEDATTVSRTVTVKVTGWKRCRV